MANFKIFAVRFCDEALRNDFLEMIEMFNRKEQQIICRERNNVYELSPIEGKEVVWELAMHKYMSYSKDTIVVGSGKNRIPRVIFSHIAVAEEECAAG